MSKIISTVIITVVLGIAFASPKAVLADGSTTCTNSYGQPVACPKNVEKPHEEVQAGLADVSLKVIGLGSVTLAGYFYIAGKKKDRSYQIR